mgnify:CR=1 FL=1
MSNYFGAMGTAILNKLKAGTALVVGSGYLRVRTDLAPWAGPILSDGQGWAAIVITIPWRWDHLNT